MPIKLVGPHQLLATRETLTPWSGSFIRLIFPELREFVRATCRPALFHRSLLLL
jgi:hypothetical protein